MPSVASILLWLVAGACFHGAINHLVAWRTRRDNRISAYFGLMCLLGGLYAFFSSLCLYTTDYESYHRIDSLSRACLSPLMAFIPMFLAHYANLKPSWFEKSFAIVFISLGFVLLVRPPGGFLKTVTSFTILEHPFGGPLPSPNGPMGWGGYCLYALYFILFIYTLWIIRQLRRQDQRPKSRWLLGILILTVLTYLHDLHSDTLGLPSAEIGEDVIFLFLLAVGADLGVRRVKTERNYWTLFHSINDGICVHDAQSGQILDVNDPLCRMFAMSREQMLSADLRSLVETGGDHTLEKMLNRIRLTPSKGSSIFEWRARRLDGTLFWVEAALQNAELDGQHVVLATIRNIDSRVQAREHQIQSDEFSQAIVEGFDGFIFICSQDRQLEFANHRLAELLGHAATDKPCQEVLSGLLGAPSWCDDLNRLSAEKVHREIQGPEGRWFDVFCTQLKRPNDRLSTLVLVRDITNRIKAEEEKHTLLARIHQGEKLESLGVLAGGAAHDFNNLLTAILGNADLAGEDLPPGSSGKAAIDKLKQAARKAADLTKQLLAYSGQGRFKVGSVSVNHMIREVVDVLRVSLPHVHHLEFDLDPSNPQVLADSIQFRQIIMNLLTNAGEAIEGTHGTISFTTRIARPPDSATLEPPDAVLPKGPLVLLEVKDEGRGMSEETRRRMFEPFYSTKFTGRGLGMAAVLGIVRSHSGAIQVESSPGKGTAVRVWFPAAEGTVDPTGTTSPVSFADIRHALVVDDEPLVCDAVAAAFHSLGWEVTTANDGMSALESIRSNPQPPDLVLMDLAMPRLDGRQTAKLMREVYPKLKILMMSGAYARPQDDPLGFSDMDGFLLKPFSIPELKEHVRIIFDGKKV